MPISAMASMAWGLTLDGCEPALITSMHQDRGCCRAKPSAIWLRAELATQRKRIL